MAIAKQNVKNLENKPRQKDKNSAVSSDNRDDTSLWMPHLDINTEGGEGTSGTYTRMPRTVNNVSWRDKISNDTLYDNLGKLRPS